MAQQNAFDRNVAIKDAEFSKLQLPPAPLTEVGTVKAWEQPVRIRSYMPAAPDPNPLFLEKRVYQGSSGRVYPLPVIDRVDTEPQVHEWKAAHIENEFVRLMIMPEIGGRIQVGLDKINGYDFFYRQNVIKPALVGLAGPREVSIILPGGCAVCRGPCQAGGYRISS